MSIVKSLWSQFGGKKLIIIVGVFAGFLTGSVPEQVFNDALLAFFGAQAVADIAAYWGSKAKTAAGIAPKAVVTETAAVATDTQDTPTDKPDFGDGEE